MDVKELEYLIKCRSKEKENHLTNLEFSSYKNLISAPIINKHWFLFKNYFCPKCGAALNKEDYVRIFFFKIKFIYLSCPLCDYEYSKLK